MTNLSFRRLLNVLTATVCWLFIPMLAAAAGPAEPVFLYPPTPANGQTYSISSGQTLSFLVRATDTDNGDQLTLQVQGLPASASLAPALPARSNPVQSTFTWTPTAADAGLHVLSFTVSDGQHPPVATKIILRVIAQPCAVLVNQPTANPDQLRIPAGTSLLISAATLLANDTDPRNQALQVASVGTPTVGQLTTNPNGTFTYTPEAGFSGRATFTYLVRPAGAVLVSEATGHYYELIQAPGICWSAAQAAAAARTYQGLTGYLATITSPAEQALLANNGQAQYWLGAADDVVEGEWRWKTGPEKGELFWQGSAAGTSVGYSNWSTGEPNDFRTQAAPAGEDYGQYYGGSGLWNDAPACNEAGVTAGYLVEYGGLDACTPLYFATGTVTIVVEPPVTTTAPAAPVTRLQVSPNPASTEVRVEFTPTTTGPSQLDLFDLQGRQLRTQTNGELRAGKPYEFRLDVRGLPPGVYLLRVRTGHTTERVRLVLE
ncbi:Por secretion system C-terminal sorting domain-containing protein [Hymenobacter actinosclerus]|uniref:Por secretion system C-terminal sorting domain-containing protein n=2 Tax=Hymenobacter actinosclerus TaxID=82805 RepID=A0A1I0J338_9BACT|nr:Por secretion system C-terminal sorting domain-containing protein [Hymenobacter actinosclerus]